MSTRPSSLHIFAVLSLIAVCAVASLQPSAAQDSQTGILEPEAPALAPSLWATPLELDFGPVGIGETGETQIVMVTNTGDALLANFSGGGVPAPFHMTNSCAAGVQPDLSCQYSFWVTPTASGEFNATTTINTNAGPFTIVLHAQGSSPVFTVSPLSLDFGWVVPMPGEVTEDIQADQQIVVVRNSGMADLRGFSSGSVPEPFEVTHNCPNSLPPGAECQYFYNFFPTTENTYSAVSTITTNAGSAVIELRGVGHSQPFSGQYVTPLVIDFGPMSLGNPAKAQEVILTNLSPTVQIDDFKFGALPSGFNVSQDCTPSVDPNGFCTFKFNFAPADVVVYQTTFTATNSVGSFEISLRGEGVSPQLSVSPLALDFGALLPGETSPVQVVTIQNVGQSTVTDIVTDNVNHPFSGSQNCASGLTPGNTCTLNFYYSPTTSAGYTETVTTVTTEGMPGGISIKLMGGIKPPTISKQFIPDTIPVAGVSTLQLTISDPNPAATLFNVAIDDTFPPGMVVATPLYFNLSPECGTPTFSPVAGKGSFSLTDATILGGKTCKIQLHVTAPLAEDYTNTTGAVSSKYATGGSASATLKVRVLNYIPFVAR